MLSFSQEPQLLLAGDPSDLARRVDPQMDVCYDKVLHRADIEVQPVPGGLLNWPALGLALCPGSCIVPIDCCTVPCAGAQ